MLARQLRAACSRSAPVRLICTSFSASLKVVGETSGPTGGEVPNAGGAPAGGAGTFCDFPPHPAAAPSRASVERVKNSLREFDMKHLYSKFLISIKRRFCGAGVPPAVLRHDTK